jgi:hypothetical protein
MNDRHRLVSQLVTLRQGFFIFSCTSIIFFRLCGGHPVVLLIFGFCDDSTLLVLVLTYLPIQLLHGALPEAPRATSKLSQQVAGN